VIETKSDEKVL